MDVRKQNLLKVVEALHNWYQTGNGSGPNASALLMENDKPFAEAVREAYESCKGPRDADEQQYFDLAKAKHKVEGELEIDTDAEVSVSTT